MTSVPITSAICEDGLQDMALVVVDRLASFDPLLGTIAAVFGDQLKNVARHPSVASNRSARRERGIML